MTRFHHMSTAPISTLLCFGTLLLAQACGPQNQAALPTGSVAVAVSGLKTMVGTKYNGSILEVQCLRSVDGASVQKKSLVVGGDPGATLSFTLQDDSYDFVATLTPAKGSAPTHRGQAKGVIVTNSSATAVSIVLSPLAKGVAVSVSIDDRLKGLPKAVTGVLVSPSNKAFGGERITLTVKASGSASKLSFGWSAGAPIVLDQQGGSSTSFNAPYELGSHTVKLHVHDGAAAPATLAIPVEVVKGGRSAKLTTLSGVGSTFNLDAAWSGSELTLVRGPFTSLYLEAMVPGAAAGTPTLIAGTSQTGARYEDTTLAANGKGYGVGYTVSSAYGGCSVGLLELDPKGAVIKKTVLASAPGTPTIYNADVVWAKDRYAVVWQQYHSSGHRIYFRDSMSGTSATLVSGTLGKAHDPSLVWTGSEYGVAWYDERDGDEEIYFARLAADGSKIGGELRVTSSSGFSRHASLVWTGNEYGLAWSDKRDGNTEIYFAAISAAGVKRTQDLRLTHDTAGSWSPTLSWSGGTYGLAWTDGRHGASGEIYFARLTMDGKLWRAPLRITHAPQGANAPKLVSTGAGHALVWNEDSATVKVATITVP